MTIGEKIKAVRTALEMSQSDLAKATGISERSIYTYEQQGKIPRSSNAKKLASALNVSLTYLMDEDETDTQKEMGKDIFLANVHNEFGSKGARQATAILEQTGALFAGGELDEEAKDLFFQSIMELYVEAKREAREKYTPKKYRNKK